MDACKGEFGAAAASTLVSTETNGRRTEVNEVCRVDDATDNGASSAVFE